MVVGMADASARSMLAAPVARRPTIGPGKGSLGPPDDKRVPSAPGKPQVWHRDSRRPSFARVYVGDGNALELVSLRVTVSIEGPRARTLVDHVFRNPHDRQLEGTFEYPLPTGASPSYYAMFVGQQAAPVPLARRVDPPALPPEALASLAPADVARQVNPAEWGTLREARVVAKEKALDAYEEIIRRPIDPALLEYASGNTFSGRVFPIPPKGYNRVLIAYEELLPCSQGQVAYRFPLPDCGLADLNFTLQADADVKDAAFRPEGAVRSESGGRITYTRTWTSQGPGSDVQFTYRPARADIQALTGRQGENGPFYLYARVRPELAAVAAAPFAHHAVFLLDTSLSEHPDRFAVNMKLLRAILESDRDIQHFNVLTFNVGAAWLEPAGWLDNTPAGRAKALARLDGLVLEGATDVSAALDQLARPPFTLDSKTPVNVFLLSDGQITWGDADVHSLVARFEARCPYPTRFHCYRNGLSAENLALFEALTRRGGGIFHCFGEADLPAAARAHTSQCFQVEGVRIVDGPAASDLLVAGRKAAVYPDGELVVAARLAGAGRCNLVIDGTYQGKKQSFTYPIDVRPGGDLAPRAWGEVAVACLLALNDPRLDGLVTAYCQQFRIASRAASFLVLENDNDYKRFNLEEERGKTVAGDLARFLDEAWKAMASIAGPREGFQRLLADALPRMQLAGPDAAHLGRLLALLTDHDFELPAAHVNGALLHRADVPPAYLARRDADPRAIDCYLDEAARRRYAGDGDGAVRVLSSVVEEYPGRADALRLVGYRLLDLGQPAQASALFERVQRNRPFEPHSYRDLARGLEEMGNYALAAVHYEIVLAGAWHPRFGPNGPQSWDEASQASLRSVATEEYARMMREALRQHKLGAGLAAFFGERLEHLPAQPQADLRVTISWNTDATDVDLWVIEPDGTKCFYQKPRTAKGGELSSDQRQGYGPERYQVLHAQPGVYRVLVHYFSANPNLLGGETHVNVVVTRHAGTPDEHVERHTVVLKHAGEQVEVCQVKF
jgi:hypothetical protein